MSQQPRQTYRSAATSFDVDHEITPPRPSAQALHEAHTALYEAQQALDAARAKVPSYTGSMEDIDYYGDELEALNRAVDAFEDAIVASVSEAAQRRLEQSQRQMGPQT